MFGGYVIIVDFIEDSESEREKVCFSILIQ